MSKKYFLIVSGIVLIATLGLFVFMRITDTVKSGYSTEIPTVFVHGYKGTYHSFGNMLNRFEEEHGWGKKVIVYEVTEDDELRVSELSQLDTQPAYIQVVFDNNRASFDDSAYWLSLVLAHLKEHGHVDAVNLVGHSMGGIVALKYIEEYQDELTYPQVSKLVTLGSPFDGVYREEYFRFHRDAAATDLIPKSPALNMLKKNRDAFPRSIDVLSIGSTGDLIADTGSVQTLGDIITEERLQEIMIDNPSLGHSALHENEDIDQMVHTFLYENHDKSGKSQ